MLFQSAERNNLRKYSAELQIQCHFTFSGQNVFSRRQSYYLNFKGVRPLRPPQREDREAPE